MFHDGETVRVHIEFDANEMGLGMSQLVKIYIHHFCFICNILGHTQLHRLHFKCTFCKDLHSLSKQKCQFLVCEKVSTPLSKYHLKLESSAN